MRRSLEAIRRAALMVMEQKDALITRMEKERAGHELEVDEGRCWSPGMR